MSARTPSLFCICDFPTACWFIWNCPPEDEPPSFVLTAAESVWSLSCGSGGDMAWDRLTAARGSLCDYSLQRHFQKIALAVGSTWCSSLVLFFVFFSFGVFFNVAQRGVMEKGTLKAPPHHQQDGRAVLSGPAGVLHPACSSVAQRMHLQLC